MIGGMISSTVLTLVVIPAIYGLIKGWRLPAKSVPALEEIKPLTFREAAERWEDTMMNGGGMTWGIEGALVQTAGSGPL